VAQGVHENECRPFGTRSIFLRFPSAYALG
jgi:hypothetical protein